jgi:hypothetical protein
VSGAQFSAPLTTVPRAKESDSLRGVIHGGMTGPISLARPGQPEVTIVGRRTTLRWMPFLTVTVFGHWSTAKKRTFLAERELVRAIFDTIPAFDGVLRREPAADFLELPDGQRVVIAHLPPGLQMYNGSRVVLFDSLEFPWTGGPVRDDDRFPIKISTPGFARDSVHYVPPDSVQRRWLALTAVRARINRAGHSRIMKELRDYDRRVH